MKNFLRLLVVIVRASRQVRRSPADVSRIPMRVLPNDLDTLGHMNNGVFLTLQDIGRVDWMVRTGLWARFRERGWFPVVTAQTITYRSSLDPGVRFLIETRYLGHDDYGFFLEQRFTVGGQVHSAAIVRGRFISARRGRAVPMNELLAEAPEVAALPDMVPAWAREWAEQTRLPSTRAGAPSVWRPTAGLRP